MSNRERLVGLIRTFNDPVLSQVCDPVMPGDDLSFLQDLRDLCRATDNGVGLAAPQIGVAKRACFVWHARKGGESILMLNPRVVTRSEQTETAIEGCLSYPCVEGPVERPARVEVVWQDPETWQECRRWFAGFQARVVQHEIDHLDAVCRVREFLRAAAAA